MVGDKSKRRIHINSKPVGRGASNSTLLKNLIATEATTPTPKFVRLWLYKTRIYKVDTYKCILLVIFHFCESLKFVSYLIASENFRQYPMPTEWGIKYFSKQSYKWKNQEKVGSEILVSNKDLADNIRENINRRWLLFSDASFFPYIFSILFKVRFFVCLFFISGEN